MLYAARFLLFVAPSYLLIKFAPSFLIVECEAKDLAGEDALNFSCLLTIFNCSFLKKKRIKN